MDHTRRDMDHGAGSNFSFLVIEDDFAFSFEYIVQFGGSLVVMGFCPVDVDRVGPCGDVFIILTDETIAVPAGAAFLDGFVFMPEEQVARGRKFVFRAHFFFRGVR